MAILWVNLFVVSLSSFFARYFSRPSLVNYSTPIIKPNKLLATFVVAILCIVAGLRHNIGDTYFYMHTYKIHHFTWNTINYNKDFGFSIFQMYLQKISSDPQILVLSTAIIINCLIGLVLYRYSRMFELSVYIFITSGMYTVTMNGIRESLAASISFIALKYVIKGDFRKYLLIILIAATFHRSALVLIPIYFIVRREAWTKITLLILTLAVVIVLGYNMFSNILFSALSDTHYEVYKNFKEGGANIFRTAVSAVPVFIAFIGRHKLRELWPKSDVIVNFSIISLMFSIISLQNWIFDRFNIYFNLYNIILLSWVIKLFAKKDQKLMYFLLIICYFIYFYYEQVVTLHIQYRSSYLHF